MPPILAIARIAYGIDGLKFESFRSFCEEFDLSSERTLAAWIRHASRTRVYSSEYKSSGERVSNA